jgi:hypothetical protein
MVDPEITLCSVGSDGCFGGEYGRVEDTISGGGVNAGSNGAVVGAKPSFEASAVF